MIFYSFYYLAILILFITDYSLKNIKIFSYLALLLVIIISGTRYGTGYDFYNYHNYYVYHLSEQLEPLFILSIKILKIFVSNSQSMFFLYSLVTLSLMYYTIMKYTKYIKTSFLIYLLIPGLYLNTFSIIRQGLAESILFLAFFYLIYKKNFKIFFFLALTSFLFHYSALIPVFIVLILYPLLKKTYSITIYILFIILSIILYEINFATILLGFASGRYVAYLDFVYKVSIIKIIILNSFMLGIILFKKKFIHSQEENTLLNILFIGIIMINIFADFSPMTRLSYYLVMFQIILIPKLIYSFKENITRFLFLLLFLLYYVTMVGNALIIDMSHDGEANMIPYKNYFFQD